MCEHTTAEFYEGDVVKITLSPNPTRDDLNNNFLAPLDAKLSTNVPFSIIVDSTRVVAADVTITQMVIAWLRFNRERFKKYLRCTSIVLSGTIIRNILDVVFKVQTPVAPMKMVSDMESAWDFVGLIEHQ
jgi:hypothetical protein